MYIHIYIYTQGPSPASIEDPFQGQPHCPKAPVQTAGPPPPQAHPRSSPDALARPLCGRLVYYLGVDERFTSELEKM